MRKEIFRPPVIAARSFAIHSVGVVALIVIWQIWVMLNGFNTIVMPSPVSVVQRLLEEPLFFGVNSLRTIGLSLIGLAAGAALGTLIAVLAWWSRLLNGLLAPVSLIFSSVPIVAIIPILLRVFGYDWRTAVIVVALITFFSMYVFTLAGLRALPPGTADVLKVFGASKLTSLRLIALPASIPHWFLGLKIAAPLAVLAAMVAEFLMSMDGLGNVLDVAREDLQMDRALAASLCATFVSVCFYFIASRAEKSAAADR
ncbi:ABC transporter permease subunit [Stappia sp. BW2]|uniref:ABC transporter permease n=1 Tax=Stappia sp. BW2 TaxID=2592622 RepID=UPI0011DEE7DD|nr:ABC transporter permease subunit [Stappia sp. BW2]TYC64750.1 ABC transporter permease subunit [Stappia sp. BW2]